MELSRTDEIIDAYVNQGLSIQKIAESKALGVHLVWSRLRDAKVLRQPGHHMQKRWAEWRKKLSEVERLRAKLAAAEAELEKAWRPEDWEAKPQWHTLANKLLSCEFISNPDLKLWAITARHYSDATYPSDKTIQRIRKWIRRSLAADGKPVNRQMSDSIQ